MALNCTSSKFSVIDINGVLTFFDLTAVPSEAGRDASTAGVHLSFERKDVWDMRWSDDDPELFAMMEKTRMYIFRGTEPEEPVCTLHNFPTFQLSNHPTFRFSNLRATQSPVLVHPSPARLPSFTLT
jgi:hypothetical protein